MTSGRSAAQPCERDCTLADEADQREHLFAERYGLAADSFQGGGAW